MPAFEIVIITCSSIITITGALFALVKLFNPIKVGKDRLEDLESKVCTDFARLEQIDAQLNAMIRSQLAIVDNLITGNHVENLKKVKEQLNDCIFDKKR